MDETGLDEPRLSEPEPDPIEHTQDEALFVKCDRTAMTQDDFDNGRLICLIDVAPVKPAEFVIFRISQYSPAALN